MIATLSSYECFFGPRHIQTLALASLVAGVLRDLGEQQAARGLLERVVRDADHACDRTHAIRIAALHALRDLGASV